MFIAYVIQEAEGCDYSITCGKILWNLEATTKEDALKELKERIIGKFDESEGYFDLGYWEEHEIKRITLFEVKESTEIKTRQWYDEANEISKDWHSKIKENKELAEYKRLKDKFGK
jgi:hypothetical protein